MCVFAGPVGHVTRTKIFARHCTDGREVLAYSMRFAASSDVAMALPLPVPIGSPEDAVQFLSLEGQDDFFKQLDQAFPGGERSRAPRFGPRAGIVVDLERPFFRSELSGRCANRDVTLEIPLLEDPGALDLRGRHHH